MWSAQHAPGLVFSHAEQNLSALRLHRQSCRPGPLTIRFLQAAFSARPLQFLELLGQQLAMLRLAADDGSELSEIYEALQEVGSANERFWLGPTATHKQTQGWRVCQIPKLTGRYCMLVRKGEVADAPLGLCLHRAQRRRHDAHSIFALFVGWLWFVFITMAITNAIGLGQLIAYLCGSLLVSLWLTRGPFVALRADQQTLDQVNKGLQLHAVKDIGRR